MNVPIADVLNRREGGPHGNVNAFGDEGEVFDFVALIRVLRKRLGVVAGITLLFTGLALVAVYQMTPQYTAETLILLEQQKSRIVDAEAVMSGLGGDSATVDSQVEILQSRSIARRVVVDLDLVSDPEFNGNLRSPSVMQFIDPRYWLSSLLGESEHAPVNEAQKLENAINDVVGSVIARTSVSRRGMTYVISLRFTSEAPSKAMKIANALADAYVVDQLEAKFDATKKANAWLSSRLTTLRAQVQDSERAVEIYRSQNGLQDSGGATLNEQQLSELNAQLILARTNLAEKQAKYTSAREILQKGGNIESVADVLQSQTISALRSQEAELARQQADLSSKYGPRHPSILNIDAQRTDIQRQIGREVQRIVGSIQNEATIAQSRVDSLQGSLNDLRGTANLNNQAFVLLRELEREADANKTIYESFLNRFKETSQQSDLQTSDARVISVATLPTTPSKPNKRLTVLVALIFAGLLGVGMALILERLDNTMRTAKEVEDTLGQPHLVSMPMVANEVDSKGNKLLPHDYVVLKPLSAFAESVRSLRSALALSNVDSPPKVLLFTSSLPAEGKTTTSVCFARAAAQSGLRVVLLDCDLRHPSVQKTFQLPTAKLGLVELLAGSATLNDVLVPDAETSLLHIPVAAGTANPPDVLGSMQMKKLLAGLRDAYDLVVLDSAPVLPVSDSRVLSGLVDKTVFVVRWSSTPKDAALSAVKDLTSYGAEIAGVVMSAVDTEKQAKYGYGDGGYYYRRYNQYYVN